MLPAFHRPTAWLLIATSAILAGAGEALHCLPGCGHGVRVGEVVLLLGVRVPRDHRVTDDLSDVDRPHVDRPSGQDIPVYGEDKCAICSTVRQTCSSGDFPLFFLVMPLMHDVPVIVLCEAVPASSRLFQGRAPPVA